MLPTGNALTDQIRSFDWSATSVGAIEIWPQSLRTAVEIVCASPIPMLLLWGSDGLMIYNDAYAALAGTRHPELLGSPILEGWPELQDFHRQILNAGLAGETSSFRDKLFVLNRRGAPEPEDVWLNLDFSPVRDEAGRVAGVLGIIVETTSRLDAERARRESEERFRTLADNIAQFAWMADRTGYIFWYNQRWFDYTGTTMDEMRGWGWRKVHHPDHVDRVVSKITRCFETGEDWEDTFPLRAADGSYRWFLSRAMPIRDEAGNVVRWFGTNTDITEHLLEAERNAQLATIVSTSPDAIIALSEEGIILSWNAGAEALFGYTADEVVGKSERLLFAAGADKEFEEKYQALRHGKPLLRDAVRRRKDGSLVDVAINAAPMRNPDGKTIGFSAVISDISARKRDEKHMRLVMRELSHRTKNLLAVILAMVRQTALSSTDVADFQIKFTQRVHSLAASHDLLVAEDWTGASLEDLVRAVLRPFTESSSIVECEGPSILVNATAAQNLGLALHELATNAAKYGALSTSAGAVHVTWEVEPRDDGPPALVIRWRESGGPPVAPPASRGFGHVVIKNVVGQALNAHVTYEFPREGVRWSIAIPLDFIVRGGPVRRDAAGVGA